MSLSEPNASTTTGLAHALQHAQVIVCAGTGGVGKTTLSASLALRAACMGRRTLVLTIDPARRLADALGIETLSDKPARIDLEPIAKSTRSSGGSLFAMMLDPKPTFDRLVDRLTDDEESRQRILDNRMYQQLSEALAGSAEYAAMEQVNEAVESNEYDLVVVDTPPASHALDFLAAPRRLRAFLEGRFVGALLKPAMSAGRFGFRIVGRSLQRMLGLIERIGGRGFIDDLSEFLSAVAGIADGFLDRALRVEEILMGESTRFVLVGGARSGREPGTLEFLEELEQLDAKLAAIVLNRIPNWPLAEPAADWLDRAHGADLEEDVRQLEESFGESHSNDGVARNHAEAVTRILRETAVARADSDRSRALLASRTASHGTPCYLLNERPVGIDGLESLFSLADPLLEGSAS